MLVLLGGDLEQIGVERDDVGLLRAGRHVAPQLVEHLVGRELADLGQLPGVVRHLQLDEIGLRRAQESGGVEACGDARRGAGAGSSGLRRCVNRLIETGELHRSCRLRAATRRAQCGNDTDGKRCDQKKPEQPAAAEEIAKQAAERETTENPAEPAPATGLRCGLRGLLRGRRLLRSRLCRRGGYAALTPHRTPAAETARISVGRHHRRTEKRDAKSK